MGFPPTGSTRRADGSRWTKALTFTYPTVAYWPDRYLRIENCPPRKPPRLWREGREGRENAPRIAMRSVYCGKILETVRRISFNPISLLRWSNIAFGLINFYSRKVKFDPRGWIIVIIIVPRDVTFLRNFFRCGTLCPNGWQPEKGWGKKTMGYSSVANWRVVGSMFRVSILRGESTREQ